MSSCGAGAAAPANSAALLSSKAMLCRTFRKRAELTMRNMPTPPQGRIYEVWLKRDGEQPSPTNALFGVTSSGSAAVDVPGNLHGVTQVMVTPEPLGGSLVPTRSPVVVAQVPPE